MRRTTANVKNATADPVTMWQYTVPDDEVMQVTVHLLGRLSDNSKVVQVVLRGIYTATGGTATLRDSELTDPIALNYGSFSVTDISLDASGANARLRVGGNAAADYYFTATIFWQTLGTDS